MFRRTKDIKDTEIRRHGCSLAMRAVQSRTFALADDVPPSEERQHFFEIFRYVNM